MRNWRCQLPAASRQLEGRNRLPYEVEAGGWHLKEAHMRHTDEDIDRRGHPDRETPPRRREESYEEQVSNVGVDPGEPAAMEEERAERSRPPRRERT
jgi:hypothetical protein